MGYFLSPSSASFLRPFRAVTQITLFPLSYFASLFDTVPFRHVSMYDSLFWTFETWKHTTCLRNDANELHCWTLILNWKLFIEIIICLWWLIKFLYVLVFIMYYHCCYCFIYSVELKWLRGFIRTLLSTCLGREVLDSFFSMDLQDFLLRARVLKLYRQALRIAGRSPTSARGEYSCLVPFFLLSKSSLLWHYTLSFVVEVNREVIFLNH